MSPPRRGQNPGGRSLFPDLPGPASGASRPQRNTRRGAAGTKRSRRQRTLRAAPTLPTGPPTGPPPAGSDAAGREAGGTPPAAGLRARTLAGSVLMAVWAALLLGRLAQVQIVEHETMAQRADSQHHHELTIPPFRGRIYDRNGRPLALTVAVDSVYVVPPDYTPAEIPAAAKRLAACLGVSEGLVERRLRRSSRFSWLKRKAAASEVDCVRQTGHPVGTIEEHGRFYPAGSLAAHALGFVGVDGNGLGGIEFALDEVLRGEPGRRTVWTDGRRTSRGSRVMRESRAGADIELTIDSYLQAVAEEELERGMAETSARSGAVILVEPSTGEVLAMASAPSFDPNRSGGYPAATLVNRTITDPYEPGSVFKMFTAAAALNEGVTHEDEPFDTHGGRYRIGGRTVRDWKPLGPLTFAGVIGRSSNIGTLQVAQRLGSETFRGYLASFGFGSLTGLPLGGESRGIVPPPGVWRPIRLATVSFGQGIAVTPVQLVQGVNTIAAGGVRVPLRLIRRVEGEAEPQPAGERVVAAATAARVAELLAGAVESGTGGNAAVQGFSIAGKTGTAQKAEGRGYSETDYTASFAGFAPTRDPLFTGVVLLDVQKPNHSGAGAARVFGRISDRVLWRYRQTGREAERVVAARLRLRDLGMEPALLTARAAATPDSAAGSARDRVALRLRRAGAAPPAAPEWGEEAGRVVRRAAAPGSSFAPTGTEPSGTGTSGTEASATGLSGMGTSGTGASGAGGSGTLADTGRPQ